MNKKILIEIVQNKVTHPRGQERENIENFSDIISQQYKKIKICTNIKLTKSVSSQN